MIKKFSIQALVDSHVPTSSAVLTSIVKDTLDKAGFHATEVFVHEVKETHACNTECKEWHG